jgi:transcriptional regulator with XRE-family HTH domain
VRTRDDPVVVAFAGRVRAERERRGWTLEVLADRASMGISTLWRLENGRSGSSLAYAARIADALGLPLDDLVAR